MESPLVLRHSRRGVFLRCGLGLTLALDILRETSEFTSSWRRVPLGDRMGDGGVGCILGGGGSADGAATQIPGP